MKCKYGKKIGSRLTSAILSTLAAFLSLNLEVKALHHQQNRSNKQKSSTISFMKRHATKFMVGIPITAVVIVAGIMLSKSETSNSENETKSDPWKGTSNRIESEAPSSQTVVDSPVELPIHRKTAVATKTKEAPAKPALLQKRSDKLPPDPLSTPGQAKKTTQNAKSPRIAITHEEMTIVHNYCLANPEASAIEIARKLGHEKTSRVTSIKRKIAKENFSPAIDSAARSRAPTPSPVSSRPASPFQRNLSDEDA